MASSGFFRGFRPRIRPRRPPRRERQALSTESAERLELQALLAVAGFGSWPSDLSVGTAIGRGLMYWAPMGDTKRLLLTTEGKARLTELEMQFSEDPR